MIDKVLKIRRGIYNICHIAHVYKKPPYKNPINILFYKKTQNYHCSEKRNDNKKENINEQINKQINNQINEKDDLLWNIFMFDRNISFFSVSFYVLLCATLTLHFYNNYYTNNKTTELDKAKEREQRNLIEVQEKRNQRGGNNT
ncbi:conserved Plasmodium protein, unknown function [Plasmodium reichenowi]|uniref:Uncharacterized protein n=1 Tax=Plasmodium reichenowi TaxID=5854 RepID=A0A151LVC2_PLARE|nr:hypothetical protein PRSY57_0218200 [Plasmodium reichenowi]KYO03118.1 hypothetical protein PRSY57_0218200 [Plasmodium reichenowi]SOV75437.1 conserved Plasmodium protein, unknown function [Plasmodium reichenowi]